MKTFRPYPKRDPKGDYFPLPNEIFLFDLSPGELAVYDFLMRCENRKTYQCHPSYGTIGEAIGRSKNSVRKYIRSLQDKHLIRTARTTIVTKSGKKRNGSLLYTICPIGEAIRYRNEQEAKKAEEEAERRRVEEQLSSLIREYDKTHPSDM